MNAPDTATRQSEQSAALAKPPIALDGIRVLDASGAMGQYCGKLFADLGADVILVEPIGGSATRREGPFIEDRVDLESSLAFAYMNTSKRGVTLNLDHREGQSLFHDLASRADLIIESEQPGVMAKRGLGYAKLSAKRPSLVYTSITAFGQTGPYASYGADDLIGLALGGMLYLGGYADSPPIGVYGNQAYAAASLFGAVASMAALYAAEATGGGDHIDVSMQECMVLGLENAAQTYDLEGTIRKRYGGQQRQAAIGAYPCKDGYVFLLAGGIASNRFWIPTVQWLIDERAPGAEALGDPRWLEVKYVVSEEGKRIFASVFEPFTKARTKKELVEAAIQRRIPLAPVSTPADVLQNRQLKHRGFFVEVMNRFAGRPIQMPGAPYKLFGTPWRIARPAPALGEHNREVFAEIGLAAPDLAALFASGVI
jgi:benzylsuccinate CoA-transferase BbsE subunit